LVWFVSGLFLRSDPDRVHKHGVNGRGYLIPALGLEPLEGELLLVLYLELAVEALQLTLGQLQVQPGLVPHCSPQHNVMITRTKTKEEAGININSGAAKNPGVAWCKKCERFGTYYSVCK
jgi:hypothetical protein